MSKQYLSTPLRRSVRRFMVTGLTTTALVGASMSASAVFLPFEPDACKDKTIYAVHDKDLNDSQIVTIATDFSGNEVVQELGPLHTGLDLEGLDVSPLGKIYASSGDDGENPGYLYEIAPTGSIIGAGIKICFEFPGPRNTGLALAPGLVAQVVCGKEISSLSFNPADNTLWGWAEECGLIKIDPIPNAIDPIPNATLFFPFPNNDGVTCLDPNPSKITPIVEDMTWDNAGEKIYYAYKSEVWVYDPEDKTGNPVTMVYKLKKNIEAIEMFQGTNDVLLLNQHSSRKLTLLKNILTPGSTTHYPSPITVGEFKDIEAIGTCSDSIGERYCILEEMSWRYTKDSIDDSSSPVKVGNTEFEIYGMAVKADKYTVTVAINSRLPVGGMSYHGEQITWGDLIFDFLEPTGPNEIGESKIKYGVHFDAASDSGVVDDGVGLYEVTGLKSVYKANSGHKNFTTYKNYISRKQGHPSLGDLPIVDNGYFGNKDKMPTSIDTGTKVADDGFEMLNKIQLEGMGLNFVNGLAGMIPAGLEENLPPPHDPAHSPRNPLFINNYGNGSPDGVPYPNNEGPYYRYDEPRPPEEEPPLGTKPKNELGQYTFGFRFNRQDDMAGQFLMHLFTECGNDGIVKTGILPYSPPPL
jgi:hypothetical protein